jgi:murein DD-endopeptidase MepM/ murein hydrolase activator NlpD
VKNESEEHLSRGFYIVAAVVVIIGCAVTAALSNSRHSVERELAKEQQLAVQTANKIQQHRNSIERVEIAVERGTNFSDLLRDAGLDQSDVAGATQAARSAWNLRRIVPGHAMWTERTVAGEFKAVVYRIDADRELWLTRNAGDFEAAIREIPSHTRVETVTGKIDGSLFESIAVAGEQPELAVRFADILAWDIDFYTDPRAGDEFAIVVEKKQYDNGQTGAYGRILALRYNNAGHVHEAILFHDPNGKPAYYTSDGKSLQKSFLKSPLKFAARVSSHFSKNRFHPVLKAYRAHLGTDYAAPIGTPVQAVANGRVEFAGRSGGSGNMVKIAHSNGFETYYLHLSRILVRRGANVQQGQRIGLVGMTGLATGPHLDFRVQRRGQFMNFEHMQLPAANPVAKNDRAEFNAERDKWIAMLSVNPGTAVAQAAGAASIGGK